MVEKESLSRKFDGAHEIGESVSEFLEEGIRHLTLNENERYGILLAVDEAVANIIDHAYKGKGGKVEIGLFQDENTLIIKIHDKGRSFDPTKVQEYRPEEQIKNPQSRGRGLYIMKALMDEVKFEFNKEGNLLTLVKRF